ncbi:MAG: sugar phosphate isomerase/epimerase [Actinobacteria bacterium]|nr:sugar phosphate isomerase/epimerase [Actinomycetota bacterium]
MGPLRLLASTGAFFARPLDWAFGVIAEAGFDGVELMVTQDPASQDAERITAASRKEGVAVPVLHGPFLLLTRRVFGSDLVQKARTSLDLAAEVGSDLMVVHPPFRWQRNFHQWLIDEGDAIAAELGTRVGVENLYPVPLAGRSVRLHKYTEPAHLEPFRDIVFDTSHFGVTEVDIVEAWRELHASTAHIHVSDNRGQGRDSHAPLGHGVLPLASFLHDVTATPGFSGSITLELDCRRYLDDRSALVGFLRQEREKCVALLDGAPAEEVLGRPDRPERATGSGQEVGTPEEKKTTQTGA